MRPLRKLRLLMGLDSRDVQVTGGVDIACRSDNLRKLLAEARNLRVLALSLPEGYLVQKTVGDVTYQHLYEVRIAFSEMDAEVLLGFDLTPQSYTTSLDSFGLDYFRWPNGLAICPH